jgi:hypothetical protein
MSPKSDPCGSECKGAVLAAYYFALVAAAKWFFVELATEARLTAAESVRSTRGGAINARHVADIKQATADANCTLNVAVDIAPTSVA